MLFPILLLHGETKTVTEVIQHTLVYLSQRTDKNLPGLRFLLFLHCSGNALRTNASLIKMYRMVVSKGLWGSF